jgi:hypothetical protein
MNTTTRTISIPIHPDDAAGAHSVEQRTIRHDLRAAGKKDTKSASRDIGGVQRRSCFCAARF